MNTKSSNSNFFFVCFLLIYSYAAVFIFATGVMDANYVSRCKDVTYNKITYYTGLQYAYKLGCYLGEDVDEN